MESRLHCRSTLLRDSVTLSRDRGALALYADEAYLFSQYVKDNAISSLFRCEVCQKEFKDENVLKMHKKSHDGCDYVACNICNKGQSSSL